jgi:hypothetical protein
MVIGLLCLAAFVLFTLAAQFINKKVSEPPDITTAPYQINTASRVYYAKSYNVTADNTTIMKDWWEMSGNSWVLHKESFTLDRTFGKVTPHLRKE